MLQPERPNVMTTPSEQGRLLKAAAIQAEVAMSRSRIESLRSTPSEAFLMTPASGPTERDRFEEWARGENPHSFDFTRDATFPDIYRLSFLEHQWRGWQAARASVGAEVEYGPGPVADMMSGLRVGVLPTPPACAVCPTCGDQGVVCIGNNLEGQEYDPCPDCCPPATPPPTAAKPAEDDLEWPDVKTTTTHKARIGKRVVAEPFTVDEDTPPPPEGRVVVAEGVYEHENGRVCGTALEGFSNYRAEMAPLDGHRVRVVVERVEP